MPLNYSIRLLAAALAVVLLTGMTGTVFAESPLPDWIRTIAGFWSSNQISDEEFVGALQYLVKEEVLIIPSEQAQIDPPSLELDSGPSDSEEVFLNPTPYCSGNEGCIPGYVTKNIDGDTIKIYGKSIRMVLVDAPERGEDGYKEARDFIENKCPVGSFVIVDEDDFQREGSYERILGVVHCNGVNLNEAILDAGLADLYGTFCSSSEFENSAWAQTHGC